MLIAQTEAEELPSVSVNPYFSFGPVTKAVSELKQQLNESSNDELVKVAKTGEREDWRLDVHRTDAAGNLTTAVWCCSNLTVLFQTYEESTMTERFFCICS